MATSPGSVTPGLSLALGAAFLSASIFPPAPAPALFGQGITLAALSSGPSANHQPITVYPQANALGSVAPGIVDLYRQGVHIRPQAIDVGQLMGARTDDIYIWNATGGGVNLAAIVQTAFGGESLGTGPSAPIYMPINAEWHYVVTSTLSGPGTIAASADWVFSEGYQSLLVISGERVVVMPYRHNWSAPVIERLQWLTDIMLNEDGSEQRVSHRAFPRRSWEYQYLLQNNDAAGFENRAFGWQALPFTLPIWRDWQPLAADLAAGTTTIPCTTTNRAFVAGQPALLWASESSFEAVLVQTVASNQITIAAATQSAWPAGTRIVPMRASRLMQPLAMQSPRTGLMQAVIDWEEEPGADEGEMGSIALGTYQGFPVYLVAPERSSPASRGFARAWTTVESAPGVRAVYPRAAFPADQWDFTWLLQGRDNIAQLRGLLSLMKGRLNPVWFPAWQRDALLAATVGPTDTNISVFDAAYSLYIAQNPQRRDLYILLKNGSYYLRRIVASSRGTGVETLTLDSALGVTVAPADVLLISFLDLRRLDQDLVEFAWINDSVARVTVKTMAVPA